MKARSSLHFHGDWVAGIVIGLCLGMVIASADVTGIGAPHVSEHGGAVTEIDGPDSVVAGQPVDVAIQASGSVVSLLVIGAMGINEVSVQISNGEGVLHLDKLATEHAGVLTIQAGLGSAAVRHDVRVEPGPVTAPIVAVVGQRTLVVGVDPSMVVATPSDAHGNAVAAGHDVNANVRYPEGSQRSLAFTTRNLVGYAWLESSTTAGLGSISLTAPSAGLGAVTGHALEFQQVAGAPDRFELTATPARLGRTDAVVTLTEGVAEWSRLADGRTLWRIRSTHLKDSYGNTIPDGTSARLVLSAADGWRQVVGVVVDGHIDVYVPAPTLPGVMTMTAEITGVMSPRHYLTFRRAVLDVPVQVADQPDDDRLEVIVGPVLLGSGGYVPDGTVAALELSDGSLVIATLVLRDGIGVFSVSVDEVAGVGTTGENLRVSVLGTSGPVGVKQ